MTSDPRTVDPRLDHDSEFFNRPEFHTLKQMHEGRWYIADSPEIAEARNRARRLVTEINGLGNLDPDRHNALLRELLSPESELPEMWAPMQLEYGSNTVFGEGCFVNLGVTILDLRPVRIGAHTQIGPNCDLITASHPVNDWEMRSAGWENAKPITIGEHCWLGARVTVVPGVTIGDRCVIAAGAVVTRDVPSDSLVGGVPARVIRDLSDPERRLEREDLDQY